MEEEHWTDWLERSLFFDWLGEPIGMAKWSELFGDRRHLGDTQVDDVRVSTVYLGVDHGIGIGPPLIFETMIFGGPHHQQRWLYATEREAREGHAEAVALLLREARARTL